MSSYNFTVQKRQVVGKENVDLRKQSIVPGVIYGPELKENINIQMDSNSIEKLYLTAGESSVVNLQIEGEDKPLEVVVKDVAYDPLTLKINHVDFYKIKAGQKIEAVINLKFVGESEAVKNFGGTLVTTFNTLRVKCLPKDLVHEIEVDMSVLKDFETTIHVKDLNIPKGMEVQENMDDAVASVSAVKEEKAQPVVVAAEAVVPEVAGKDKKEESKKEEKK